MTSFHNFYKIIRAAIVAIVFVVSWGVSSGLLSASESDHFSSHHSQYADFLNKKGDDGLAAEQYIKALLLNINNIDAKVSLKSFHDRQSDTCLLLKKMLVVCTKSVHGNVQKMYIGWWKCLFPLYYS